MSGINDLQDENRRLKEKIARYEEILNTVPIGIQETDAKGVITYSNRAHHEIHGVRFGELIGRSIVDLKSSQDRREELKAYLQYLVDEQPTPTPWFSKDTRQDGTMRDVRVDWDYIRGNEGEVAGFAAVVADVTAQKLVEREKQIAEERVKMVLEGTKVGLWDREVETGATFFSEQYFKMLGYDPKELPHNFETWKKLLHPEDKERVTRFVDDYIKRHDNVWDIEFRLLKKEGGYAWINSLGKALAFDSEGKTLRVAGIHVDISERKKYEALLVEEKNKLEAVFSALGDGITMQNLQYEIVYQNDVHIKMQGGHVGEHCYKAYQGKDAVCDGCLLKKCFSDGKSHRRERAIAGKDGQKRYIEVSASPVRDAFGSVIGGVETIRDISERKKLEKEVEKSRKIESLGVLAGGIAHDFNNLLAAISGNVSLAQSLYESKEDITSFFSEIIAATGRAHQLTKQLLTFAKGGDPVTEPESIENIINNSARFFLAGSNVKCCEKFSPGLWRVEVDSGQISQVVQNLVQNAVQAMPDGGEIQIKAENTVIGIGSSLPLKEGRYVHLIFQDQGSGIHPDIIERVFDPYFTTKANGSGLGLAVCYSIIKKHNGHIMVSSDPNNGAVFEFWLPALDDSLPIEEIDADTCYGSCSGFVLVMDDEEMLRNVTEKMLKTLGYEVATARDGQEAVTMYQKALNSSKPFDLLIMDLTVPGGMGGEKAGEKILSFHPEAKILVTSGYSGSPVMAKHADYGFLGAIEKPFSLDSLSQALKEALAA